MDNLNHPNGVRAAIALTTLVRSLRKDPGRLADELERLMRSYIRDLDPSELSTMVYTLAILAADPVSADDLQEVAKRLET